MSSVTNSSMRADVFSDSCVSRTALQHLTGRWGALVLGALKLSDEPMRFGALRRRVQGISDRMLSQTLSELERDGMVTRTVLSAIPPNVEYSLTGLGSRVSEPLLTLIDLLQAEFPNVLDAQRAYDEANA